MINAIELKNTGPIELELSGHAQVIPGKVGQKFHRINYRDIGCAYNGYAFDESDGDEVFSNELYLIPLDEKLETTFSNLRSWLSNRSGTYLVNETFTIPSNGSVIFGIYHTGGEAKRFNESGPRATQMGDMEVPTTCYDVCTEVQCNDNPCIPGGPCLIMFLGRDRCKCVKKETRRNSGSITTGIQRQDVRLEVSQAIGIQVRFADFASSVDPNKKYSVLLRDQTAVDWDNP